MSLYYTDPIAPKHGTNLISLYPNHVGDYFKWKTPMQNEWTASAAQLKPCLKNSLVWRQELSSEDELLNVLQNAQKRQHIHIFPLKWANFTIHRYRKRVAGGGSSSVPPDLSLYLTIFLSLLHTFLVSAPTDSFWDLWWGLMNRWRSNS